MKASIRTNNQAWQGPQHKACNMRIFTLFKYIVFLFTPSVSNKIISEHNTTRLSEQKQIFQLWTYKKRAKLDNNKGLIQPISQKLQCCVYCQTIPNNVRCCRKYVIGSKISNCGSHFLDRNTDKCQQVHMQMYFYVYTFSDINHTWFASRFSYTEHHPCKQQCLYASTPQSPDTRRN